MNTLSLGLKYFFVDLVGGIIRWPLWWYTTGLIGAFKWAGIAVNGYAKQLAIIVWVKNLFVPMYGTRDIQSRIISFFIRSAQIFGRGIALLVWLLVVIVLVAMYLVLPIVSLVGALIHISALFV